MHDILIAGGGYAGLWAAFGAARQAALSGRGLDIALVSRDPWLTARPRLYEHGLTQGEAQHALAPLLEAVGARLVQGEIAGIDRPARRLTLADGRVLEGRVLLLALGSRAKAPPFAGSVQGIDTWPEAEAFWSALKALTNPKVAVIGGGFTGIELALELAGWRDAEAPGASVLLVDRVAPASGYGGAARAVITGALRRFGIETVEGKGVAAVEPGALRLEDGSRLPADIAVWAGGLEPSAVIGERLGVDLQLRAGEGVFAAGDVASAPLPGGHSTVLSCQHALSTGAFAGHNAARHLLGEPLMDYAPRPYVTCLDLGPAGAVLTGGFERELRLQGEEAKALKRSINRQLIVPPLAGGREALFATAAAAISTAPRPAAALRG